MVTVSVSFVLPEEPSAGVLVFESLQPAQLMVSNEAKTNASTFFIKFPPVLYFLKRLSFSWITVLFPYVQLYLYPAKVQGEGAAQSIAGGISFLDEFGVDVILAGRGGGSMEDLWAFNEEIVAQAIYECRTPVISAVGHETDVTIADYVADLRAPTPSAAAELAVYDVRLVLEELYGYKDRLARCILAQVDAGREHLDFTEKRLRYLNPENQMVQKRQYLIDIEERLFRNMKNELQKKKQMMSLLAARLDAKSPLKRLAGGYAYVTDEAGRMVDSVKSLQVNDVLMMTFSDGVVKSEVQEVVEEEKA